MSKTLAKPVVIQDRKCRLNCPWSDSKPPLNALNAVGELQTKRSVSLIIDFKFLIFLCSVCTVRIVTPEASRITVFINGTCLGLNGWIPVGGQVDISSIVGDSLVWKNAQKSDTKNETSETMNRIIPHRNPFVTIFVCNRWYVPSRVTSRHHWITVNTVIIAPIPSNLSSYWWNHLINPIKVSIALIGLVSIHGLLPTMWNGCCSSQMRGTNVFKLIS